MVVASVRTYRVRTGGPLYDPLTDKVNCAECAKDPEVPARSMVTLLVGVLTAAVKVIDCGVPGVSEKF